MDTSSNIKELPDSNNKNPIMKRFIPISDTMGVLPIPESIIKKLNIDDDTWFEEIPLNTKTILANSKEFRKNKHKNFQKKVVKHLEPIKHDSPAVRRQLS
jgi:hypothetical protein